MARIRSIKPEFWTSEQVVDCSPTARLLFIGLWSFADDAGRLPASARRLKMQVFPADEITTAQVEALILELRRAGLVVEYENEGERFWAVTGWARHQRVEKPTVRYPAPEDSILRGVGEESERSRSGLGYGVEWSGEEEEPTHTHPASTPRATTKRASGVLTEVPLAAFAAAAGGAMPPSPPMPPTAPPPGVTPPSRGTPPRDDAALKAFFAAFCRGANLALTWHARYILPAERIAAAGLSPDRVRAVAAHYRAKLRDGTPSLPRFAEEIDRWQADLLAKERPSGAVPQADAGKCPSHPSQSILDGPCELCEIVAGVEAVSSDWNPPTRIRSVQ